MIYQFYKLFTMNTIILIVYWYYCIFFVTNKGIDKMVLKIEINYYGHYNNYLDIQVLVLF